MWWSSSSQIPSLSLCPNAVFFPPPPPYRSPPSQFLPLWFPPTLLLTTHSFLPTSTSSSPALKYRLITTTISIDYLGICYDYHILFQFPTFLMILFLSPRASLERGKRNTSYIIRLDLMERRKGGLSLEWKSKEVIKSGEILATKRSLNLSIFVCYRFPENSLLKGQSN